jgi:hypothetical protein
MWNIVMSFAHDSQAYMFAKLPLFPFFVTFHLSYQGYCAIGNENTPAGMNGLFRNFMGGMW